MKNLKANEFEKRFEKFLRNLRFEDRIFLVFDKDVDGVTSAVITLRTFEKLGIKIAKAIPDFFAEKKFQDLKNFDAGVIVDVPTPTQRSFLRKTKKKMLVIDHHPSIDVQSRNVFYINPRLIKKEIYQPTSYIVFKLFSNFIDLKNERWIAVLGTVGDYAFDDVRDLYKNEVNAKRKKEIWKTSYGRAATRLNSAIALYGPQKAFEILNDSKSLNSFFKNKKIQNAHKKFSKEFWDANIKIKNTSESYPRLNLIFARVNTKYARITSALSTKLSSEHPNSIIILADKIGKKYRVHGRMQNGKIHIGELMENFGGGGHRNAGAALISEKDLPLFKKRLLTILSEKK